MWTRWGGLLSILCFSLVAGLAQPKGPVGKSAPPATDARGSATHPMTIDVVVTDKSGKPIPGLQSQDFTLLDNKQPQKILSFRAVDSGTATTDAPAEVILLVDEVNASLSQVAVERDGIKRFVLQNGGELARPVSVIFLSDTGSTIVSTASRDGNAIMTALDQKKSDLRTIGEAQGFHGDQEKFQLSLHTIEQLDEDAAKKPGRELVVWISPGWPLLTGPGLELTLKQQQTLFTSIVALSDAMRHARVTLYDVDPLGTADAGGWRTNFYKQFVKGVKKASQVQFGNLALQVLADQTGGLVLNSSNDVGGEIAACAADGIAFYALSFDGLPGDGPNEYHAIEVKVDKPGLTARTRSGYYAQPEPAQR